MNPKVGWTVSTSAPTTGPVALLTVTVIVPVWPPVVPAVVKSNTALKAPSSQPSFARTRQKCWVPAASVTGEALVPDTVPESTSVAKVAERESSQAYWIASVSASVTVVHVSDTAAATPVRPSAGVFNVGAGGSVFMRNTPPPQPDQPAPSETLMPNQ